MAHADSPNLILIEFQDRHKRLLRYLHVTDHLHAFLALLLFLQQLALPRNVAAITFSQHVFAERFHLGEGTLSVVVPGQDMRQALHAAELAQVAAPDARDDKP